MLDRREFILSMTISAAMVNTLAVQLSEASELQESPIELIDLKVISWKPPLYHGWPTLAKRENGELLLAFSGGRESHVYPFGRLELMRSKDNGVSWGWPQVLYDGPIDDDGHTLQTESRDGGRTWSVPHSIGVWGLPSHLLRLRNNNLLMSYGHRRSPLGIQARLSKDFGNSWGEAIFITSDAKSSDLGYPSSIECADGTMVTVWYEVMEDSPLAQLRQARWKWR